MSDENEKERDEKMSTKAIIVTAVAVIIIGAGAFYGGMQYQQYSMRQGIAARFGGDMPGGMMGAPGSGQWRQRSNQGMRPVSGEIIESDAESITVKTQDGSTKIVLLTKRTSINKAAQGTKDDLKKGERVMVIGNSNSDGSVTADNIQLNPMMGNTPRTTN